MKILKVFLFISLFLLSACSSKAISKPYDLAILDGQRVVTFSDSDGQLEQLEERKIFDKPLQLWTEGAVRMGDSLYNRTTEDHQFKTYLAKLNTQTFDVSQVQADGNDSYTRTSDGDFIYSTAVFNDRTEFYKYDKNLKLVKKQSIKEEGKMNLTNDILVIGDNLYVLVGSIDINTGTNENELWRVSKDLTLEEKIDLDYTEGGYMRMVHVNGTLYITEAKEGVAENGEPNGGRHIVAFNLESHGKTFIETEYSYPQYIRYDEKRNRLLVLHDPNYVPQCTWTFIELTTGKQSHLRFEDKEKTSVPPFYTEHDGSYYYLFDSQLIKYDPDTEQKTEYDLSEYGITQAHTVVFGKDE